MGIINNLIEISVDAWALEHKLGELDEAVARLDQHYNDHQQMLLTLKEQTFQHDEAYNRFTDILAKTNEALKNNLDAVEGLDDRVGKLDEAILSEADVEDIVESTLSNGGYITDSDVSDAVENALNDRDLPDGDELTSRMDDLEEKLDSNKGLSAEEVQAIVQTELGKLDTNLGVSRMANALERIDQRLADISVAIRITR